jgi:hypothetical protein
MTAGRLINRATSMTKHVGFNRILGVITCWEGLSNWSGRRMNLPGLKNPVH